MVQNCVLGPILDRATRENFSENITGEIGVKNLWYMTEWDRMRRRNSFENFTGEGRVSNKRTT